MKKVIRCGRLFTGTSEEDIRENVLIIIENDRIIKVTDDRSAICDADEEIDLSDKFVLPGLIDCHVHTHMDGVNEDFNGEKRLMGSLAYDAMRHARQDLDAGFTTVRDEGSTDFIDVALRDEISAGRITGPRMIVSGWALGPTGGHSDLHRMPQYYDADMRIADSPFEVRKAARFNIKYGVDQIKLMVTGGVMSKGDTPGAQYMADDEIIVAVETAKMHGKLTSAHAHGADGIKAAVRAGITSIEHGMMMDEECIRLMKEHGTYLVPTIIAAYQVVEHGKSCGLAEENINKAAQCLKLHEEHLRMCREAGVKIAFGTDAGTMFNLHGKQALEFRLMNRLGFRPAEALLCATKNAAELLHMSDSIGSVKPGKFADIVAVDGNPIRDISVMEHVGFVMKSGEIIKQ